jgi:hypothetical protein
MSKLTLENAPIGTKAPAIGGGYWVRTHVGWTWPSDDKGNGSTFPRPGADWTGELRRPINWPFNSFDAQEWAEAFHERFPAVPVADVLSWFANALMRGYDEYAWRLDMAEKRGPGATKEEMKKAVEVTVNNVVSASSHRQANGRDDDPPEFTAEAMKDAVLTLPGQSLVETVSKAREQRHAEYPPHPGPEAEEQAKQMVEIARRSFGFGLPPQSERSEMWKGRPDLWISGLLLINLVLEVYSLFE